MFTKVEKLTKVSLLTLWTPNQHSGGRGLASVLVALVHWDLIVFSGN